mgnify:CR=1 FL=1
MATKRSSNFSAVRGGLAMIRYGSLIILVGLAIAVALWMLQLSPNVGLITILTGYVFCICGLIRCLGAPAQKGLRCWIVLAFGTSTAGSLGLAFIIFQKILLANASPWLIILIRPVPALLIAILLLGLMLFAIFLCKLALVVDRKDMIGWTVATIAALTSAAVLPSLTLAIGPTVLLNVESTQNQAAQVTQIDPREFGVGQLMLVIATAVGGFVSLFFFAYTTSSLHRHLDQSHFEC